MHYVFCVICATFVPIQEKSVELDFTRISQPTVASQLELSDEQRAKVAELLTKRINELAAAKPEDRAAIRKKNNEALMALLSPAQLASYQTLSTGGKLRFNFSGEKWGDVLNWFAKQSELSLVMDQSPPGEFTYSDQKEFSPPQAIDLLNSILLSKGFTLIRRERMLIVSSLADGIPYELVPNETQEGLAKRGKFEWVRLKFPLAGRPVAAVLEEVKPMISTHGLATPLTASGQLMVTETAGKMEAIGILISAVPVPKAPPPPPPSPAPIPKVFVVHSAKGLDINGTVETLQKFFDTTAVVGDSKAEEIQVYAPQATQDLIKTSLDQMIKVASTDLKSFTEVYPITDQSISSVQEQLSNLFSETTFSIDSDQSRLIVSANAKTHRGIQETLTKLGASTESKSDVTVVVYASPKGEAENLATVLTEMLPRSQVIVQGERIAVRGKASDHQIAKSLIDQVAADNNSANSMLLRFYSLNENHSDITSTIQSIAKNGTVTWLESQKKLSVIADVATHDLVKKTIDQINLELPKKEKRSLRIFAVLPSQKAKFNDVFAGLASEFGDASLVSGAGPDEIAVLATEQQHAAIDAVLKSIISLKAEEDKSLIAIPISVSDSDQLIALLGKKLPEQEFLVNPEQDSLFAWVKKAEVENLKKMVAAIEAILPRRSVQTLEVYKINGPVSAVETFVSPIAGEAKITMDADNGRIVVWATENEHQKIKATIEKVDSDSSSEKSLEVYELQKGNAAVAQTMISNLKVDATVTETEDSKSLLIWATLQDHQKIKSVMDELATIKTTSGAQVELYSVDRESAAKTLAAVQAVFPSANVSLDSTSRKIISIAADDLQPQIKSLIQKLQPEKPASPKVLMSYELKHSDSTTVVAMLGDLHPEIRFAADERANRVLVTAELAEQPRIKAIIGQLDAKASDRDDKVLKNYELKNTKTEFVTDLIEPLFPEMKFSIDQVSKKMMALGSEFDHQKLTKLLGQVNTNADVKRLLKHYPLGSAPVEEVRNVLLQIVPTAIVAVNGGQGKIVIWATAEEQKIIESAIQQLNNVTDEDLSLKSFDLERQASADMLTFMKGLSRTAQLSASWDGMQVVVLGTADDIKLFESVIAELNTTGQSKQKIKAYVGSKEVIASATSIVSSSFPKARLVTQPDAEKLIVWAADADHSRIELTINDLKKQLTKEESDKLTQIYPLGKVVKTTAQEMLANEAPDASILSDNQDSRLIVRADAATHAKVAKIIADLKKTFDVVEAKIIKSHAVRKDIKTQATTTIGTLLPAVEFLTNGNDALILAKASLSDHQAIGELLKTLDAEIAKEEPRTVAVYKLTGLEKPLATEILTNRFPDLGFVSEDNSTRLLVWAIESQHGLIPEILKGLEATIAIEKDLVVEVYNIDQKKMAASNVLELIDSKLKENVTIQVAAETNSLIIRAPVMRHKYLQTEIDAIVSKLVALPKPTTQVYNFPAGNADSISDLVSPLLNNTTIAVSPDGNKFAATSNAEGHELIQTVIEQLTLESNEGDQETVVYRLNAAIPSVITNAVSAMSPEAKITADDNSMSLIVTATGKEHQVIANILKQINDSTLGKKTEVFTLKVAEPSSLVSAISALVTGASATADVGTNSVVVTAMATDFPQIQAIVDKLDLAAGAKAALVAKVYPFDKDLVDANDMVSALDEDLQKGIYVRINEVGNGLIIRATAEKHKLIQQLFDQITEQLPEKQKIATRVYRLDNVAPDVIDDVLGAKYPASSFSVDSNTRTVVATVSLGEHEKIKVIVDEMESLAIREKLVSKSFKLRSATPSIVAEAISALLPNAKVTSDLASQMVIVTGIDAELQSASELVKQIDGSDLGKTTQVYKLVEADPRFVSPAIEQLIPAAKISADRYSKALFVTATDEDHQQVQALIEKLNGRGAGQTTEVYKLDKASSVILQPALSTLIPDGNVTADKVSNTLVVSASKEDQAKVSDVIEKLDKATDDEMVLKIYKSKFDNPDPLNQTVGNMFRNDPAVRITFEWENKRIMIVTTEAKHKLIGELIEQVDQAKPLYDDRIAKVYHLENIESQVAEGVIRNLYGWWVPRIEVKREQGTNALIVVATAEQHEGLKASIKEVDGDLRQLEVFPLVNVEPYTIELAIEQLFAEIPENMRPSATSDFGTQQLFVRGTVAQIKLIRDMLNKMGESFGDETQPISKGGVRTIPFRGNALDALREIEAFWPRVRRNKIEIIRPNKTKIQRGFQPRKVDSPEIQQNSSPKKIELPNEGGGTCSDGFSREDGLDPIQESGKSNREQEKQPRIKIENLESVKKDPLTAPQGRQEEDQPKIVVIPGDNEITIASSDHEALDQLEHLLRTIQRGNRGGIGSSNFAVYLLSNSSAKDTAKLLGDLFDAIPTSERQGSVGNAIFVADERLNAMIVYGTRKERDVIQEIIEVLDAEDLPDSLTTPMPELVHIQNSSADRVLRILSTVYSNQLVSGGGRRKVDIPEGVSSTVATMLQQINAASSGPILTLGVDQKTNSIVMRAPLELGREIKSFVDKLESTAREAAVKNVRIYKVEGTNAARVREIISNMANEN